MADGLVPSYAKSEIFLERIIGRGNYSTVYLGRFRYRDEKETMIVKLPNPKRSSERQVMQEVTRMASLNHPNIIRLLGIAVGTDPQRENQLSWLLMDYASKGDLVNFIKHRASLEMPLDQGLWTRLSLGIAQGMKYLHDNLIVHCDLHTQNCFVNKNNVAKVGDFGLSYPLGSEEEEANLLHGFGELGRPRNDAFYCITGVRWKCPEYIPGDDFMPLYLRPADVWAYGVLLYEFWSEGKTPFDCFEDTLKVTEVIVDGKNPMDFHQIETPPFITEIMEDCFGYCPNSRPKFSKIVQKLQENQAVFNKDSSE